MADEESDPCVFCNQPVGPNEGDWTVTEQGASVRFHYRCRAEYDRQREQEAE